MKKIICMMLLGVTTLSCIGCTANTPVPYKETESVVDSKYDKNDCYIMTSYTEKFVTEYEDGSSHVTECEVWVNTKTKIVFLRFRQAYAYYVYEPIIGQDKLPMTLDEYKAMKGLM